MLYADSITELFRILMIAKDRNPAQLNLSRKGGFYWFPSL